MIFAGRFEFISVIWNRLDSSEKKGIWWVMLIGVVNAVFETYGVFLVYLFIRIVQDPLYIYKYDHFGYLKNINPNKLYLYVGITVALVYIIKSAINILNLKITANYSSKVNIRLSNNTFYQYMKMPYIKFIAHNPNEMNDIVRQYIQKFSESLLHAIGILTEFFIVVLIFLMLVIINWKLLLIVMIFLTVVASLILKITGRVIGNIGKQSSIESNECSKVVYNGFFNYKLIKLTGLDKKIIDNFNNHTTNLGKMNIIRIVFASIPKIGLEMICFIGLISGVIIGIMITDSPSYVISIATLFLFVMMKILPSLVKSFYASQNITYYLPWLKKVPEYGAIEIEDFGSEIVTFNKKIELKDIGFNYLDGEYIFKNINIEINKSDKVGIIGPSGVGKSTLQDIIIGLIRPTIGSIEVDGKIINETNLKSWRSHVGYIPQEIYLYSGTVAENIVLNREYDEEKLITALRKAHIYDFLMTKDGINTQVGNNGVMLSGGQKQRIGIARALYNNPAILVLDEATSALDEKTEQQIMQDIYSESLEQTLLIITHRPSTLSGCNKVYKLSTDGINLL